MERSQHVTDDNREQVHEEISTHVRGLLREHMRPEFLNRIDDIIVFHSLSKQHIKQIAEQQLQNLSSLLHDKNLRMDIPDEVLESLIHLR